MNPIRFPEVTMVLAENQPEYLPLPVWCGPAPNVEMISCWRLTWRERLWVLLTGQLWLRQFTFGHALQPQLPQCESPFVRDGK